MALKEPPLCIDCKYFRKVKGMPLRHGLCVHKDTTHVSVVDGSKAHVLAMVARQGTCGPFGKSFAEKAPPKRLARRIEFYALNAVLWAVVPFRRCKLPRPAYKVWRKNVMAEMRDDFPEFYND